MKKKVVIIGAGIGGLSAAIKLAQSGFDVHILEARQEAGGLASGVRFGDFNFDSGPYILLDKPGLSWALEQLNVNIDSVLPLRLINDIYEVNFAEGPPVSFSHNKDETARKFEANFSGSGARYLTFVQRTSGIHKGLQPMTFIPHPGPVDVIRHKAWRYVPFLLSSLHDELSRTGLPPAVQKAIGIWTYIAGQPVEKAPAPMAFVPSIFHSVGAYYPLGGMASIARLFIDRALKAGVTFTYNTKIKRILTENKTVSGVLTDQDAIIKADAVISNASAIGTYENLLDIFPQQHKKKLGELPLQSPGVCIYLAVKGKRPPHYIQFKLNDKSCVAFVQPGIMEPELEKEGWFPARLIAPLEHTKAGLLGEDGQQALIKELLTDTWWQENIKEYKVLHTRTSIDWGNEFNLYKNSMNPVMTARFMLKGRFAHKSPYAKGLYLAGSSTHPGQWVSFCAVSGVLAANSLIKDLKHA